MPKLVEVRTYKPRVKRKTASRRPLRSKLIKDADTQASLYVRQSRANEDGLVECYTCDHIAHWKKMQNGHWIVRQYKNVRWDEDNMRPQCYACNFRYNGRPHVYRENLVAEIGEKRVKALESRAKSVFKESDEFIVNIASIYRQKLAAFNAKSP